MAKEQKEDAQRIGLVHALENSEPTSAAVLSSPIPKLTGSWKTSNSSRTLQDAGFPNIESEEFAIRPVLKGRFLVQQYSAMIEGHQYSGIGTLGFDEGKQEFVEEWKDSLGNVHSISTGDYEVSATRIALSYVVSNSGKDVTLISEYRTTNNISWMYRLYDEDGNTIKQAEFERA